MLPEIGTRERERLEEEALKIGMEKLHEHDGSIADALYGVYQHFRARFIDEYGLMDQAPGGNRWREMLTDARQLEWHVSQVWASTIVHGDTLRRSSSRPSPV